MKTTLYGTPTCEYTKLTKDYLINNSIPFDYVDVSDVKLRSKIENMVKISGQMGVPVVDVGGKVIVGWNKQALNEVYGL